MDGDISDYIKELEANPPPPSAPRREPALVKLAGWAFFAFVYNTELFGEGLILGISRYGQRQLGRYRDKARALSEATVDAFRIGNGEAPTYSEVSPRKRIVSACGLRDPGRYSQAIARMKIFCAAYSAGAERDAMELGLPIDSAEGIAAFFYLPALHWDIARSLFSR